MTERLAEIAQRVEAFAQDEAAAIGDFIALYRKTEEAHIDFLLAAIKNPNTDPRKTVAAFRKQMLQAGHNEGWHAALARLGQQVAELKAALEPFARYHALDGVQNGRREDEIIVRITGADGLASITYGDLRRAARLASHH